MVGSTLFFLYKKPVPYAEKSFLKIRNFLGFIQILGKFDAFLTYFKVIWLILA